MWTTDKRQCPLSTYKPVHDRDRSFPHEWTSDITLLLNGAWHLFLFSITLVTTLLDPKAYPAADLLELRLRRWDIETNIAHLKTTMKMDVLHCKTEQGVRKELAVFSIVYNLVKSGHAGSGAQAAGAGGPDQFRRHVQVDASRAAWRHAAGLDRQSVSARSCRAPVQEAAAQAIRPHEQTAEGTTKTAEK